jgi:hypothetical protein
MGIWPWIPVETDPNNLMEPTGAGDGNRTRVISLEG